MYTMSSLIDQLYSEQAWEEFLAYRLTKRRFKWHEFDEADLFIEDKAYKPIVEQILSKGVGIPHKQVINKMGSNKKRIVYQYDEETMTLLKLLAYQLYRYDDAFTPNCYAFRRGIHATDAVLKISNTVCNKHLWGYKVDIHNYFNSVDIPLLMGMLEELLRDDNTLLSFFRDMLMDDRAEYNGEIVHEARGVLAGVPTASFLANVYLMDMDHYFHEQGVIYARYSDDIIIFAKDYDTLQTHRATILRFLAERHLEVNPSKEHIYAPDEAFEFLGFECLNGHIDVSASGVEKMKGKIRRKTRALLRWQKRKGAPKERAMARLITIFNHKFFDSSDNDSLTWSRWYFPIITEKKSLEEIDHYLQQCIRLFATGHHTKANYRVSYDILKELGYRSLVNEYYKSRGQ